MDGGASKHYQIDKKGKKKVHDNTRGFGGLTL
jgi:hypothetical protein